MVSTDAALSQAAQALHEAERIVAITGAGVSAESGISTFRGAGGYWDKYRAEELASPQGFQQNPELVWRWYQERQAHLLKNTPNPGHFALAELEKNTSDFLLVTQNVDGYHQMAGSQNVVEVHGSIWEVKCTREPHKLWRMTEPGKGILHCECQAMARPNVLWFGETYDTQKIHNAVAGLKKADAVIVAGTSGMVWIVAGLLAETRPAAVVIDINIAPESAFGEVVDHYIQLPFGEAMPRLNTLISERNTL